MSRRVVGGLQEANLDSYEVYATTDFKDEVKQFEETGCVAERALMEDGLGTGGRLRWNEAGDCVCHVIHKYTSNGWTNPHYGEKATS